MWSVFDCDGLWRGSTNDESFLLYIIAMVEEETGRKCLVIDESCHV